MQIVCVSLQDVIDYFVFEKDEEGDWIWDVERLLICVNSIISSIYVSFLVMHETVYLELFLEKVYMDLSK